MIAGNHDISLDERYYSLKGQYMQRLKEPDNELVDKAKELWTGEKARRAGVTYLEEGTYSFVLKNGARLRVCICAHVFSVVLLLAAVSFPRLPFLSKDIFHDSRFSYTIMITS